MNRIIIFSSLILLIAFGAPSTTQAQRTLPRFETSECPIAIPSEPTIECGTLIVPEDYTKPDGRTVSMAVIIVRSRNGNPRNEALLFTEGGPGYSSMGSVWWLTSSGFGNDRDIVILEQRGNKFAEPSLACDFSVWWEETEGRTPCLEGLRRDGIALEHYTTASIAADINSLKQVLNYDAWVLYGTSYSTRPMQLVMARFPEKIRSVVLHSVSPITDTRYLHDPEHSGRALQVMFDDCAADPGCSSAYPDLERKFYDLVRQFNNKPLEFELTLPQGTTQFTFEVSGETLIAFMDGSAFYGPAYPAFETAYLPLLIDKLSSGNSDLLYPWVKNYVGRWGDDAFAWGLYFAVNCQDDAASTNSAMLKTQNAAFPELDGYSRHREELKICSAWGLDPSPPLASEPVASDIPALVLAGRYDPITPLEWSRTALTNLSNSAIVEFPASGHSVNTDNPCAQQITAAFLDDPGKKPDLSCLETAPHPRFVLPDEIILAPAIYEIHYGELGYSMLEENLFLGSWLTLIGSGLLALIASVINLARRRKPIPSAKGAWIAISLLIMSAITALFWGYALRFALQSVAASTSNILRFGLPARYWWLFVIVLLIGLMTIALIVMSVLTWKRSYWRMIGKIGFSLATLAAVIFCSVLARWGLFTALVR